jgi:hypothetical protein
MNWIFNTIYQWIFYYGEKNTAGGVAGVHDSDGNVQITAGGTNKTALVGTGNGTGAGVSGTGGGSGGSGIVGQGTGAGAGVLGTGGATSGAIGVHAVGGSTNGVGVRAEGVGTGNGITASSPSGWGVSTDTLESSYISVTGDGSFTTIIEQTSTGGALQAFSNTTNNNHTVQFINNGTGPVLYIEGDASAPAYAPLRIVPSAQPTNGTTGDLYVDSSGKLYIYNGSSWVVVGTQT